MSHVVDIKADFVESGCLKKAAAFLGFEVREKSTYKWFGRHVGDYPLPEGFSKEDLGQCEFALGVPGHPEAYEIGVVKKRDGSPGFTMLFDFWGPGQITQEWVNSRFGEDLKKLKNEYSAQASIEHLEKMGRLVERYIDEETGDLVIRGRERS